MTLTFDLFWSRLFLSKRYSKSLLILDDVWSSFVINTFNLTARVLVTTRDLTVMEDAQNCMEIIDIQSGFTKEESMALFSSYVSIPKEFLPDEALEIHKECKGSPMVISLIGSLISETGNKHSTKQRESGRWSHYLFNLKSRHMSKFQIQKLYHTFGFRFSIYWDMLRPNSEAKWEEEHLWTCHVQCEKFGRAFAPSISIFGGLFGPSWLQPSQGQLTINPCFLSGSYDVEQITSKNKEQILIEVLDLYFLYHFSCFFWKHIISRIFCCSFSDFSCF